MRMTKEEEEFKLLKIQTCVLKVNIHCDGCKQKVKKLLQKIEGVYKVDVDSEQQKVTVSGNVDSSALIKKLQKGGKYAEPWSQKPNQNQKSQAAQCIKDDKNTKGHQKEDGMIKGLKAFKNQQPDLPSFRLEDHDDCEDDDDGDDDEEEEDEEHRFIRERMGLLGQSNDPNVKKALAAAAANNGKAGNGGGVNGNVGKKGGGNLSQNAGTGALDHKNIGFAANNKVNTSTITHFGGGGGGGGGMIGNSNGSESKKMNEINGIGLGFHGNGAAGVGVGLAGSSALGMGFQSQPNNTIPIPIPSSAFGPHVAQNLSPMMMSMQGYHHQQHPSSIGMNMNMNHRPNMMLDNNRYMQPQVMYNRSPAVNPYTGYYHQYSPHPINYTGNADHHGAQMFNNDESSSDSCSIM